MRPTVQVSGSNRIGQKMASLKARLAKNRNVYVGVPSGQGSYEDGTKLAVVAAVNEFGANIRHPGGTKYVMTEKGARFVSDSYSGPVAGTTSAHTINIPERSFLRVPLRANQEFYRKIIEHGLPQVIEGSLTMHQLMSQVGARAVGDSQQAIESGIAPPNAPSTIRRKGSATPLMDTGALRQSITYVVEGGE